MRLSPERRNPPRFAAALRPRAVAQLCAAALLLGPGAIAALAAPPEIVDYQGRVSVAGVPFDGTGHFKFALVNAAGDTSFWSNDGTSLAGSEPTDAVDLPVASGIFTAPLGDTSLPNMTVPFTSTVLAQSEPLLLRVWFDDGASGFEQLSPDLPLQSVPFALQAQGVTPGIIGTNELADGAITPSKIATVCAEGEVLRQIASGWACVAPSSVGLVCNPGDFISCFDGPASAIDVGVCRAGRRFCNTSGDGFDPCAGEILPTAEICDFTDNDCDGAGDEDAVDGVLAYFDGDGDGYGDTTTETISCTVLPPWVTSGGDCDDAAPSVYPSAHEACDGLDNDCDGSVDNDCSDCSDPERACLQACNVSCDGDATCGLSCISACGLNSACLPLVVDMASCGQSNACDGQGAAFFDLCLRENCPSEYLAVFGSECTDGEMQVCGTDVGVCQTGTQTCANQLYGACVGAVGPMPEMCGDLLDNDCDGQTDEEGELYHPDQDSDGYGSDNPGLAVATCVAPPGFILDGTDCDDGVPEVNPGAAEVCDDGIDNDCDGQDQFTQNWYRDVDGDSYGDDADVISDCIQPAGYVPSSGDCDDADPASFPGADEVCDFVDNNCDGSVDEGLPTQAAYNDADGDGYGDPGVFLGVICAPPPGSVFDFNDCDDTDPAVNPGATEVCDFVDNNCDGSTDEGVPPQQAFLDTDGDGYGDPGPFVGEFCTPPPGTVFDDQDCDDTDPGVNPAATEVCDLVDNNCNGQVDEGFPTQDAYADADTDGYGDPGLFLGAFCTPPPGGVFDFDDCDDTDPAVNPAAAEICGNAVDEDCDGSADPCNFADFCVLQFPVSVNVNAGTPFQVFAQVFEPGITDQSSGPDPDPSLVGQVGWGPPGSDPQVSPGSFDWQTAAPNGAFSDPSLDEYVGSLTIGSAGTYPYVGRFSADGGASWLYCDLDPGSADGFEPDSMGVATVTP